MGLEWTAFLDSEGVPIVRGCIDDMAFEFPLRHETPVPGTPLDMALNVFRSMVVEAINQYGTVPVVANAGVAVMDATAGGPDETDLLGKEHAHLTELQSMLPAFEDRRGLKECRIRYVLTRREPEFVLDHLNPVSKKWILLFRTPDFGDMKVELGI